MTPETMAPLSEDPIFKLARRGGLIKPAKPAGERENTAALTPSLGTRSFGLVEHPTIGPPAHL
jgi:hypothetical protein